MRTDDSGSQGAVEDRPRILRRMIDGYQLSQAIRVAAELGIADQLAAGPRTSGELASLTGAHPAALYRLLRALAAAGLFQEDERQSFSLAWLGEGLRSGIPGSRHNWARYAAGGPAWDAWGRLLDSVRTGENAFQRAHGMDVWRFRVENPREGIMFDAAMRESTDEIAAAAMAAYDFGRFRRLIDAGGGNGGLLTRLVAAYPSMAGTLVDQAHVIADAVEAFRAAGVGARCEAVAGDFFTALPAGGDAYVLKFILHNWEDHEAAAILRTVRRSIQPQGRLLVIERTLAGPNEGIEGKFADLNMLVHPAGKERTLRQYADLFAAAQFRLESAVPLWGELALLEGVICNY